MKKFLKIFFRSLAILTVLVPTALVHAQNQLILGVSEGTSGGLDHARVIAKYQGLTEVISSAIKRKVSVVFVREFSQLSEGMETGRLDFVMARPSDYPARGVRDHGYRLVATAKPDGQCLIVVPKNSPLKTLSEARGKRWVLPEQSAYMTKFCSAELRDKTIPVARESVRYVREQASIPFMMENGFADVGAVASYSGIGGNLEKHALRLLHSSAPQPYFPLIAGKRISDAEILAIQNALASLEQTSKGQEVLKSVGVQGFDIKGGTRLAELLMWLEK